MQGVVYPLCFEPQRYYITYIEANVDSSFVFEG
jgi:hypothetical protein